MSTQATARLIAALALGILPVAASAEILDTGDDTGRIPDVIVAQSLTTTSCRIAWYRQGGSDTELERLRALGYDVSVVGKSQLSYPNLAAWDLVVIAYTAPGFLAAEQPDLQAFVDVGGALLIHQPNHVGMTDYAPVGFDANVVDADWCTPTGYAAHVDNAAHPILSGLTDADLSGAFDTVTLGAGYTVLASSPECGAPALAVGTSGLGRIVLDTGNGSAESVGPGSEAYWDALFGWLCTTGPIAVETVSWGSMKSAYR